VVQPMKLMYDVNEGISGATRTSSKLLSSFRLGVAAVTFSRRRTQASAAQHR